MKEAAVARDYEAGKPVAEIATEHGYSSASAIYTVLARMGVELRTANKGAGVRISE